MDGLADCVLREVLTRLGGYDGAVSEFIRVSGSLLPQRTFVRVCPELANGSRTRYGTPVVVQLLGSDPQCMADNAAQLAELAPAGIDLNFGCPAPTVNRHGGGARRCSTIRQLIGRIVRCRARLAVAPAHLPVTRRRCGSASSDTAPAPSSARRRYRGRVALRQLVVHARTRDEVLPAAGALGMGGAKIREAVTHSCRRQRRGVERSTIISRCRAGDRLRRCDDRAWRRRRSVSGASHPGFRWPAKHRASNAATTGRELLPACWH